MADIQEISEPLPAERPERGSATEARILDTAEVVFARRGLAGTRVREIAAAAEVNGATLYNYYPSKDALYEAVLERGIRPLTAMLAGFSPGPDPSESARRIVRSVMQHLAERPHLSKLIYLEAISEGDFLPRLARKWFRPILERIVGELKAGPLPAYFDEELFGHLAALFVQLSFGYFALSPLLAEAMDENPLSAQGVERQTRLIETVIEQLFPRITQSAGRNGTRSPSEG